MPRNSHRQKTLFLSMIGIQGSSIGAIVLAAGKTAIVVRITSRANKSLRVDGIFAA